MTLEELQIEKVPSVPQVLLELLDLFHQPEADLAKITRVIEQDMSICSKILNYSNTAFFRQWSRVSDIRRLLVVIGTDDVKKIALTSAVHQYFSSLSSNYDGFINALWIRSLLCAHISKELARLTGYPSQGEAYTAGLLHRIGQLVMLLNHPEKYLDILFMDASDSLREQTEKALFTYSSSEVGASLVRRWPLHPFVADAIFYQNLPLSALGDASTLVRLLNLATRLTHLVIRGAENELDWDDPFFGLNSALLRAIAESGRKATEDDTERFGIQANEYLNTEGGVPGDTQKRSHQAKKRLGEYAYHAALVGNCQVGQSATADQGLPLQQIRRELAIVFGLHGVRFLLLDQQAEHLKGVGEDSEHDPFAELTIDLRSSESLAVKALQSGHLCCTLQSDGPVPGALIDQQLTHLLGAEGILFLPLSDGTRPLGVALGAISQAGWKHLAPQGDLLRLFLGSLSCAYLQRHDLSGTESRQMLEQSEWYQLEARKIVHEVNNPLSIITNYLYTLSSKIDESDPAGSDIAVIREEIARIGDILARLKEIGRPDRSEEGLCHLNQTITELLGLFESTLFSDHNIRTEVELDESIPPLVLSAGALKQILINLVKNAAEAMTDGGVLRITTRDKVYTQGNIYIEILISDDGPGLPDFVLNSLFQPVASTKKNHAGLGLTIVKNLVDSFLGEITCSSSPDAGTRFQILIPRPSEERIVET